VSQSAAFWPEPQAAPMVVFSCAWAATKNASALKSARKRKANKNVFLDIKHPERGRQKNEKPAGNKAIRKDHRRNGGSRQDWRQPPNPTSAAPPWKASLPFFLSDDLSFSIHPSA
jgi:hypothetical protein